MSVLVAFLSLAIESVFGYPDRLFRAIGHPVTWFGWLISFLDRTLNHAADSDARRRGRGVAALLVIVMAPAAIAFGIETLLAVLPAGFLATAVLASALPSQRSLASHVRAVADALDTGGLPAGRKAR